MYSPDSSFKFSLISTLILLTTACGGGGGDGGGGSSSISTPKVSADLLMDMYDGSTKSASLTADDIYPTLKYLFDGDIEALQVTTAKQKLSRVGSRQEVAEARASETLACNYGGSQIISENIDENNGTGKVQVSYDNCDDGAGVYTGRIVTDYKKWNLSAFEPIEFDTYYENFRYQNGSKFTSINGSVNFTGGTTCEQTVRSNLLIKTDSTSILDKDLLVLRNICSSNVDEQTITGRVYFSEKGYVDITTPEPIIFSFNEEITDGTLKIDSDDSEINLNYKNSTVNVTIDSNKDGEFELDETVPYWYLTDENLSDIADDDDDGIPNSWEKIYGLDPNLSNQGLDSDADGYSDYYEYLTNTNPLSAYDYYNLDVSLSVNQSDIAYVGSTISLDIFLQAGFTTEMEPLLGDVSFSLPIDLSHSWELVENVYGCEIVEEGNDGWIYCANLDWLKLNNSFEDDSNKILKVNLTASDSLGVNSVAKFDMDIPYSNHSLRMDVNTVRSDLVYSVQNTKQGLVLASLEEQFIYSLNLQNDSDIASSSVHVKGSLPDSDLELTISSVSSSEPINCTVSELSFECFNVSSYAPLDVTFNKPVATGKVELQLEVNTIYSSDIVRVSKASASFSFGQDMAVLQGRIEEAGDELLVESGAIFVGRMDLNKNFTLKAEDGAELWLEPSYNENYSNTSIFSTASLSLEGFDVYTNGNGFSVDSGSFVGNSFFLNSLTEVLVYSQLHLGFRSNLVHSLDEYDYLTKLLLISESVDVYSNLFDIQNGSQVTIWSTWREDLGYAHIHNNTIINVNKVVNASLESGVGFTNNLVLNESSDSYQEQYYLSGLNAENNVMPIRFSAYANANNIFTDTPGVDPEDSYRLLPDSIAIDNGLDLSDSITTDLDGNARPSGSAFDIGAYEYQH